jgi:DASS family divalent anion:Na+ symporter
MKEINIKNVAITFVVALIIWFIPAPEVAENAWHLFAIFAATILGIILKAAPMGTMCMMAIGFTALTQVVAPGDAGKSITKALSGLEIK